MSAGFWKAIGLALVAFVKLFLARKDQTNDEAKKVYIAPDTSLNEYSAAKRRMQELEQLQAAATHSKSEDDLSQHS